MSNRHLGCFVSCAGGLYNILDRGESLGVNTVMTHPAPPQRWNSQPFKPETAKMFLERKAKGTSIEKVYFHGIYLVNLANPDKQKFHLSKVSLMEHMNLLNAINGDGVIFHTGTFKDQLTDEAGYERINYGINWIFENMNQQPTGKKFLLECAAGAGGKVVGDKFEELETIFKALPKDIQSKVGFCLDTQHMFASGYDIVNDLEGVIKKIEDILGIENVVAVHFNDSKTDFASNKDRHEDLGKDGKIGEQAMKAFLNHPKLKHLDFILETPSLDDAEGSKEQVKLLQSWTD